MSHVTACPCPRCNGGVPAVPRPTLASRLKTAEAKVNDARKLLAEMIGFSTCPGCEIKQFLCSDIRELQRILKGETE